MKKEMKIVLPFYKIAYAVSFVVILSVIRAVVFTYEIGLSIEPPFAILTAVFCADTYVQEITSNRSEVQRLYQIKKRIYSIIQRLMIQGTFLLLLLLPTEYLRLSIMTVGHRTGPSFLRIKWKESSCTSAIRALKPDRFSGLNTLSSDLIRWDLKMNTAPVTSTKCAT